MHAGTQVGTHPPVDVLEVGSQSLNVFSRRASIGNRTIYGEYSQAADLSEYILAPGYAYQYINNGTPDAPNGPATTSCRPNLHLSNVPLIVATATLILSLGIHHCPDRKLLRRFDIYYSREP